MQESSYGSAWLRLVEIANCHEGALWTQRLKVNYDQGKQGHAREVGGTSIFTTEDKSLSYNRQCHVQEKGTSVTGFLANDRNNNLG